jgi:MFS family permease
MPALISSTIQFSEARIREVGLTQIVINGACVLFTVIAIATVDRWGRRPLMLLGGAGMGMSLVAMGVMAQTLADPAAGHRCGV